MTVYHGSFSTVEKPDVEYSKRFLDFGKGFYVTADQKQAELWAKRKGVRQKTAPITNIYNLSDDLNSYNGLIFTNEDTAWLDFVARCRNGETLFMAYDFVSGSVANDDVFLTVDMYMRGIWDAERALFELRYYKTSHQICLISQKLIDNELSFVDSYEVN